MKKILLSILTLTSIGVNSQNLLAENFGSYTTNAQLSGQGTWTNNSSLPGGGGSCSGFACTNNSKVVSTGMSYIGYGSSANSVTIAADQDAVGRAFTPVTSGDIYVGFVINISSVLGGSADFFRLLNGGNYNTVGRLLTTPSSGAFFLAAAKNSGPFTTSNLAYGYDQDHLVILRLTQNPGANDDLISMYIDPNYAAGEPVPTFQVNAGADTFSGNIDRLMIRQNTTTGSIPTGRIGLVSIAKTWAELNLNLSANVFNKNTFTIASSQVNNGLLNIKSNISLENAKLSIFDIQGRKIETKTISLQETVNDIAVNPIKNTGVYIVEILSEDNQRFTQKIIVN